MHLTLKLFQDDDEYFAPPPPPVPSSQTTMVLRKRIRRIRQGMKKYNTQLVEVRRELKSCKAKMDTQNKQVSSGS
jgi:F-box protein 28